MEELLANPATTVVDVRETGEFASGHYAGAINIPLGIIPLRLDECQIVTTHFLWQGV